MSHPLRIAVIIPHLNQPQMLERCLASLWAGKRQPDEVLVVDNGSQIMPEAVCAAFAGVTLLQETTPGPGPARNRGAAHAKADVLAFIDSDCLADPRWLQEAEAVLADPTALILGGDVQIALKDSSRPGPIEAYEMIYGYRVADYIARDHFTVTCNLIMRREVFESVGGFAGLAVAEDIDWGKRANAMGYQIRFCSKVLVRHPARSDLAALRVKWDRHMAHFRHEAAKSLKGRLRWIALIFAMALSPLAEVPRILISDRVFDLRSRLLAFVVLARIRIYRARIMVWLAFGGDPARLAARWNRSA